MKLTLTLAVTILSLPLMAALQPSSVIPEKREFPINSEINPCEDFHKYACSKVEESFKLRDDRSRHTFSFSDSAERLLEAKKEFFKNIDQQKKLSARSQQIKDYYKACMDEKAGAAAEKKELQKLYDEVRALKTTEDFSAYHLKRLLAGESSFLNFEAYANQDNPNITDFVVGAFTMNLPQYTYYDNKELMTDYRNLAIDFFKELDPKLAVAEIEERVDKMLKLEKSFVDVYPHPEVTRQRWSEKRQEQQEAFLKKYPAVSYEKLLKQAPKKTIVWNPVPEGVQFYNDSLKAENLQALKDFMTYTYGRSYYDDSNQAYFKKQFDFNAKYMGGPVVRPVRQERCTRQVMNTFTKELDQLLVGKLFPNFPTDKFKNVAQKIRESIIDGVKKNTWLEAQTKAKAILKMEKAKLYLVKPETEKEWDFVAVRKYSSQDRFYNARLYGKTVLAKKIKSLKEPTNLAAWDMGPLTVNAYYDPSANKFVMPMGILQYPFFNAEGDLIENLGAVGAVIGHELGHGIDDQGSKYDETGKLNQWMTMKDLKEFSDRGRKMVEQFDKAGHNGNLTLGENIGDLVGLTFAYNAAFKNTQPKAEDEKKLFVAYARLWCGVARPKAEEQLLKTDPHALGRARINEQVKHQPAFAKAFNCKPGDKMTLSDSDRVTIW